MTDSLPRWLKPCALVLPILPCAQPPQRRQRLASSPESTSPTSAWTCFVDGRPRYSWPVSTARRGYRTPTGTFRPQALAVWHRSTIYSGSPMPHSIFFHGGYAIHGSYETKYLGRPASHGCVRLHPSNAGSPLFARAPLR